MTEQELVDRGICGVIAEGCVTHGSFQWIGAEVRTGTPFRCLVGHMTAVPVGEYVSRDICRVGSWAFRQQLWSLNDVARDVDDLRHLLSKWLTERGLDDSCCWWEVAS